MDDIKHQFKENFLRYASYVILDRAIPSVIDGLKPVQRRILATLFEMDDGKLHKVANIAGQTMALHPHGDAPIVEALVNLANKGYLIDTQGNFGNPHTGDPPAAARYIEARLSPLAKETLFNPEITPTIPSYDGRAEEPLFLPAKIPLVLIQGAEGIAIGMATKILPHNFQELLLAEIALLEGKPFTLLPDFPSGGIMDPSAYDRGRGSVKLRAKIDIADDKTLVIREICPGTTTESLIRSIDEAAKKGKIKIDAINDYTAERIEIEIKLPRGQHAKETIDTLYAFTECEMTVHSQLLVIKELFPWETTVDEILHLHVELLKAYMTKELEIEKEKLLQKIFDRTLEQIFIENRLYKQIENISTYEKIHHTIEKSLEPFYPELSRLPEEADREKLLSIPIRRISRFDIQKNLEEINALRHSLVEIEKHLKSIKKYMVHYLQSILRRFGPLFPRKTQIEQIETIDKKAISLKQVRVGYDPETGYLGMKIANAISLECTNQDKLLIVYQEGLFTVLNIPEKQYIHTKGKVAWIGIADKKTPLTILYRDKKTQYPYAKRFIVSQFILEKEYRFLDEGCVLEFISSDQKPAIQLQFKSAGKQKKGKTQFLYTFDQVSTKSFSARGIRIANKPLLSVKAMINKESE